MIAVIQTQERKIEDLEERLNKQTSEIKLLNEAIFGSFSNMYKYLDLKLWCLNI